jgi:REP element-mobilizing transposase RayT
MQPQPIYSPENLRSPAYHLRFTWSGWPSTGSFPPAPPIPFWIDLDGLWEKDGLRHLTTNWTPTLIQFTFSVTPQVAPVFFAARVKGRLQHALRRAGTPVQFSRKVAVRTIGDNHTAEVEAYISNQVVKEELADPRFKAFLQGLILKSADVDLSQPSESRSGRYWYNLHLVLVVGGRYRFGDEQHLTTLREWCPRIAAKKGHGLSRLAILPDHLHMALRGKIEQSPEEIALGYMNNLAFAVGQAAIWEFGYYVGSFSEYDMGAVRRG